MIDLEKLRDKTQECYGVVMISESEFIALLDYADNLEKDAGRYQYLRDPHSWGDFSNFYLDDLDQAIDTAMEAKHG